MKILLIEDDKKISMAMGIRLKSRGHVIISAHDAVSAVSQAVKHNPDVCVSDINLPGGDGFIVAERLMGMSETSTIPFIFITASKKPGLKERAMELGAVNFLEKPFNSIQLIEAIESAVDPVSAS